MEQLTERDLELLEHKLRGTLSESDKTELESKMQDKDFAQAAADFEMLLGGIDAKGDDELKAMLLEEEAKFEVQADKQEGTQTAKVFTLRRVMAVAATLLLLVLATFIWQQNEKEQANYLSDNFIPYRNVFYPIDRSGAAVNAKERAFKAYEQKNYTEALSGFNTILADSLDYGVLFFKANTLLAMEKVDEAITLFDKIPQHERFYEQSQWYLGLAYLEKGDFTSAKQYLKTVAENGGYKSQQSQELLKTLE